MTNRKTETLTVRLNPDVKATLRRIATHEHRSLANMVEVMIRDWSEGMQSAPVQAAVHKITGPASTD